MRAKAFAFRTALLPLMLAALLPSAATALITVGALDTPGWADGIEVVDGLAYVADGHAGLRVIDVSDPSNPVEVGALDTGNARGVAVADGLAYVADGASGLRVIDISHPTSPVEIGALDTAGDARDVEVVGSLAYVADSSSSSRWGSLRIIDISNPTAPAEIGAVGGGMSLVREVEVEGSLAYVVDPRSGLRIIDIDGDRWNVPGPVYVRYRDLPSILFAFAKFVEE